MNMKLLFKSIGFAGVGFLILGLFALLCYFLLSVLGETGYLVTGGIAGFIVLVIVLYQQVKPKMSNRCEFYYNKNDKLKSKKQLAEEIHKIYGILRVLMCQRSALWDYLGVEIEYLDELNDQGEKKIRIVKSSVRDKE